MDYITAEQFLEQPEEVRKVLIEWWQPKRFDLCNRMYSMPKKECFDLTILFVDESGNILLDDDEYYDKYETVPLLLETQLRHFIEGKTGYKMWGLPYWSDEDTQHIHIKFKDMKIGGKLLSEPNYDIETNDLLQAYWQVACEIASE